MVKINWLQVHIFIHYLDFPVTFYNFGFLLIISRLSIINPYIICLSLIYIFVISIFSIQCDF